jgi:tripartite-type tricarboxylate transporter receptor subunit TctC
MEEYYGLPRRQFLHMTVAVPLSTASRVARAQAYPTRPVRLVVGFPPGQTADLIARLMGRWLTGRLGQPIIILKSTRASPIPGWKSRFADLGLTPRSLSVPEFAKVVADETEKWGKVVKFANLKPE